ncbi:MAG: polyprenyl diphosphate synthase [Granulosicoccaceae bacterium]
MSSTVPQPRHVAIIMDGNGRWARQTGKPRAVGHQAGFRNTRNIVEACGRRHLEALTLFAFSSENWRRPAKEVSLLMDLFLRALKSEVGKLNENKVQIRFIGERSAFSKRLQNEMLHAEGLTKNNQGLKLAIAVNYGGRWDIVNATKLIAAQVKLGELQPQDITADTLSNYISLADLPEPDLFIRTGGEKRISNYLLWHLAYTELYFSDVLWPGFDESELDKALAFFGGRERRYGRTGDQVAGENA